MASHRTLVGDCDLEVDKIKGSRFRAFARPVADEDAARAFVDELRQRQRGAGHFWGAAETGGARRRTG